MSSAFSHWTFVFLQDPNSNRIAQWLDKEIVGGILDISHPMIPEASQGRYIITAWTGKGEKIFHGFDIKEYGQLLYICSKNLTEDLTDI